MIAQPIASGQLCVNEDHIHIESDEHGQALITNLDAFAFPFIRFRNGDQIRLGGIHERYQVLAEIIGRSVEMLHLANGGEIHGFTVLLPLLRHQDYFRSYQVCQKALDHIIFRVVAKNDVPQEIIRQIQEEVQELLGEKTQVDFEFLDLIPLTERGKQRFVFSDVTSSPKG